MSTQNNSRQYPARPLLGVGAIVFDGDSVLLIERGQEPLKGYWTLPGGLVEVGERLEDAVIREMQEETGLTVKPLDIVTVFQRIMHDEDGRPEFHYVIVDYLCERVSGDLCAASDVARAEFVPIGDIPNYRMASGTPPVIEKALGFRK